MRPARAVALVAALALLFAGARLGLPRLLDQAAKNQTPHGFLTKELATKFGEAKIGGAVPIYESFWDARTWGPLPDAGVMVVAAILVIAMTATTFTTQRQLMSKNMPAEALTGQYAQQQKMLLYVLPLVFGIGGVFFPIGVLIYWTTTNLWTMGQQFYVIRNNPAPGTPAFKAKQDREREKARAHGELEPGAPAGTPGGPAEDSQTDRRPQQRQQPRRTTKAERQRSNGSGQNSKKQGGRG